METLGLDYCGAEPRSLLTPGCAGQGCTFIRDGEGTLPRVLGMLMYIKGSRIASAVVD
jgi:hypothetical protein